MNHFVSRTLPWRLTSSSQFICLYATSIVYVRHVEVQHLSYRHLLTCLVCLSSLPTDIAHFGSPTCNLRSSRKGSIPFVDYINHYTTGKTFMIASVILFRKEPALLEAYTLSWQKIQQGEEKKRRGMMGKRGKVEGILL